MIKWLKKEAVGFKNIFYLLLCFFVVNSCLSIFSSFFVVNILDINSISSNTPSSAELPGNIFVLFFFLIVAVSIEEVMFRAPLFLFVSYNKKWILIFIATSSIIFGWVHGNLWNILIQGMSGFLLCILFLKTGGLQKKFIKPISCCIIYHFSFNFFWIMVHRLFC